MASLFQFRNKLGLATDMSRALADVALPLLKFSLARHARTLNL